MDNSLSANRSSWFIFNRVDFDIWSKRWKNLDFKLRIFFFSSLILVWFLCNQTEVYINLALQRKGKENAWEREPYLLISFCFLICFWELNWVSLLTLIYYGHLLYNVLERRCMCYSRMYLQDYTKFCRDVRVSMHCNF